ncbi:hypothetical protein B4U80_12340 [Leptotrombidium deliense]|uniref:Peptidase S8/S53 domain-containing protein n=1 Tax=Leptotrombidium deliense TaxID=299467 RepID=A0A443RUY1_9ACAR|nr:hypothetical protein B4U80_12340 [Leptotrombidium deliense]
MIAPGENCNATQTGEFGTFVNFGGTSAAASLVAGWAAVVQGCMKFKTPNLLAAYLIKVLQVFKSCFNFAIYFKEARKGVIQGNLRGTPNNFIHVDCPEFCDPDLTRDH